MILVTGAGGFIGRNLLLRLLSAGEEVVGVDRRPLTGADANWASTARFEVCDLAAPSAMNDLLARHRPQTLIALADAFAGPPAQIVGDGAGLLAETLKAAEMGGVRRVCIASSIAVYLGIEGPFREDMPLPPTARLHIAALKKAEEIIGLWYGANSSLEVVALRFANIYGPWYHSMMNTPSRYLYEALGLQLPPDKPPLDATIYSALSDFCHVEDLCEGIRLIAQAPSLKHGIYNIGSGQGSTDEAVRRAAWGAVGRNDPAPEPGTNRNYLDISRIAEELGYSPRHDIESGMLAYRDWLASHVAPFERGDEEKRK